MTFKECFAARLREARTRKDMTQSQLAQQIGVSANCVSLYETAKRLPSLMTVSIMSDVLNVSLNDLIPFVAITSHDDNQMTIYDFI